MDRRVWLLALSIIILAAVAFLAASLHDVHFNPGKPIALDVPSPQMPALTVNQTIVQVPLWKLLLFWLLFVVNLFVFFLVLPPDMRKKMLRQMVSLALTALAIMLVLRYQLVKLPFLEQPPVENKNQAALGLPHAELPSFQPPQMTPWWVFFVSFLVLAFVLTMLWMVYRRWLGLGVRRASDLDAIGMIARNSIADLAAGRDWGDVIVQSYMRMMEAVSTRRGLQRGTGMTPREFAQRLESAGLPAHAVQRLTRLFESARYGARTSTQSEINEAVACLNSILQACGQAQ